MSRWKRGMGHVQYRRAPSGTRIWFDPHRTAATAAAGGVFPTLLVEVAFPNTVRTADNAATWTNITDWVKEVRWGRGRRREADRYDPGEMSVLLDDRDGRFEPENASSPYYPNVRPLKKIRVRTIYGGTTLGQFSGFIDSWDSRYENPKQAECEVSATDGFKILAGVNLPSAWEGAVRATPGLTHWWKLGEATVGQGVVDSAGTMNGTWIGNALGLAGESLILNGDDGSLNNSSVGLSASFRGQEPIPGPPYTICVWFQLASQGGNDESPTLFAQGNEATDAETVMMSTSDLGESPLFFSAGTNEAMFSSDNIVAGTTYFAAGSWDGTAGTNKLRLYLNGFAEYDNTTTTEATFTDTDFVIGTGWFLDALPDWVGKIDDVLIFNRVLTEAELNALYAAGSDLDYNTDDLTDVLDDILDYVEWPASMRNYTPGAGAQVPHYKWLDPKGQKALDLMQNLADTDRAAMFIDRDGSLRVITNEELLSSGTFNTPQVVFGNAATEVRFSELRFDYSDQPVVSEVRVHNQAYLLGNEALADTEIVLQDDTAVDEYSIRTLQLETFYSTDEDATAVTESMTDRARYELDQFSDPYRRVQSIEVKPLRNPTVMWPKILGLELGTRVTVKFTTPRGAIITQNLTVEGIGHEFNVHDQDWTVTLDMSGGGQGVHSYWVLGQTGFSELGVTTYLGL